MKRLLLLIVLLNSLIGFNQTLSLDSLYVSDYGSPEAIEVTVITTYANTYSYIGSNYTITENVIDLSVCYYISSWSQPAVTTITKKLYVFIPADLTDFVLNVNLYNSQSATSCDYFEDLDSASLNFSMPLTDTVFLSNDAFQEKQEPFLSVYPNPAQNQLTVNANGKTIESIQLYNVFGEKILESHLQNSQIDLTDVQNGIYFLVIKTSEGILKKKIVVRK